ncbi:hypothetical protein KO495_06500 [Colwellia sp. D2M02]|uniref:Transmembrane protein n=1 Tax=Colwellia asteriadis TaxID=517723 RepID=A0ABP3WJ40_9GAMM|nr:hypothetical protein [Colwellia sp. D2M02]MBU2892974.1 hypothetical protein [Colwellia sp. D2M02]
MSEKNSKELECSLLKNALTGNYIVDVNAIFKEAWQKTLQSRMSINIGLCFILLLGTLVSLTASNLMGGIEAVLKDQNAMSILNIVVTIVIWPFLAGVEMMGVLHARGQETRAIMVFSFLQRGSWVALCALLTSILVGLGFQLYMVPGIILAVLLSLTIPLVVDKKLSPLAAIKVSVLSLRFKFFQIFRLYLFLFIALLVLAMPVALLADSAIGPVAIMLFLFGMTFLAPLYYNVKGILYREIFAVKTKDREDNVNSRELNSSTPESTKASDSDDSNGSNGTFSA